MDAILINTKCKQAWNSISGDDPGVYVANAMINNDTDPFMIGYALDWGRRKLQMVLSDVPADGKIILVGRKGNCFVDKEISEVIAIPTTINENSIGAEIIGKAIKCDDGSIEVQLHGRPQPNTEIIIR